MALRVFQLLLAVQGLLLPCGCEPTGMGFEDFSALLQHTGAMDPVQSVELKGQWPELDDLWDEVKASVKDLSEQVGDMADQAVQKVEEVKDQVREVANKTAVQITVALNHALEIVKKEADKLFNETELEKTELIDAVQSALNISNTTILPRFEEFATKALTSTFGRWQNLRAVVDSTASRISGGLSAAGQGKLASQFTQMIDSSLVNIDDFSTMLKESADALHGLGEKGFQEAEATLLAVNTKLNQALTHVFAFVGMFQQTFQDVVERITDTLQIANEAVDHAFASVQHNVTSVSWRVRTSARDMMLGLHRSMADVMEVSNMAEPEWHPVTMPSDMVIRGSAIGLRLPIAAVLAAVLGAVIAAEGR